MKDISLKDLKNDLTSTHVKIDLDFLRKLLLRISSFSRPYRDKELSHKIQSSYNEKWKLSPEIAGWWQGKTIRFSKLQSLVDLSDTNWKTIEKHIISIKAGQQKGEIHINFPLSINESLGSIVGHILGDGSIDKKYRQVFFTNSCPALSIEFSNEMLQIFGTKPRIWIQQTNGFNNSKWIKRITKIDAKSGRQLGLFYPKICGMILHAIFGKFADGKFKTLTSRIKNAPLPFKRGLLRAIFDDEANVDVKSQMIRFSQDNRDVAERIRELLMEFNIKPNPLRSYFRNGKIHSYFNITHIRNYYSFYHLIGFTSPEKQKALARLISLTKASHKYKNLILPPIDNG